MIDFININQDTISELIESSHLEGYNDGYNDYNNMQNYNDQGYGNNDIDNKIERMHEYRQHKRNPIPIFKMKL